MADQLKRCPFCGGKPELASDGLAVRYVRCTGCDVQMNRGSREQATQHWNARA